MKKLIIFILLILMSEIVISTEEGLIVHYNFDDNVLDQVGDINLELVNGAYSSTVHNSSWSTKSLYCDGAEAYGAYNNSGTNDLTSYQNGTINIFINVNPSANWESIFGIGSTTEYQWFHTFDSSKTQVGYRTLISGTWYNVGTDGDGDNAQWFDISDDNWWMFTFMNNGTDSYFYRTNEAGSTEFQLSSDTIWLDDLTTTNPTMCYINGRLGLTGYIDDFKIYNYALSEAEISNLWTNGVVGGGTPPVVTPITNSTWNGTSANIVGNTTTWNEGGTLNITSDLLAFTVLASEATNMSCSDIDANYSDQLAACPTCKATTTDTTEHSITYALTLAEGDNTIYCSFVRSAGTGQGLNSTSGPLNIRRVAYPKWDTALSTQTAMSGKQTNYSVSGFCSGTGNITYTTNLSSGEFLSTSSFNGTAFIFEPYYSNLGDWPIQVNCTTEFGTNSSTFTASVTECTGAAGTSTANYGPIIVSNTGWVK